MPRSRRRFLQLAAGIAALPAASRIASAQAYPARPLRLIVAYAAGATNDTIGRLVGQWLGERLGQTVIIENRPGAATNIGTEVVVRSPPDGYTLLLAGPSNAINTTLYQSLSFNFIRDIAPVASVVRFPQVLLTHPSVPATTVAEFIAYAKANPGKLAMASAGIGSSPHLAGELFKMMAGVDMIHVPYRGGAPMYTDLLSGQTQVLFGVMTTGIVYIRSKQLRGLGVTTAERADVVPDIPTIGQTVRGYEASGLYGIGVPRNTPVEIVERLNKEISAGLAGGWLKDKLADLGGVTVVSSPVEYSRMIAEETEKWAKVVKFSGVKPE